MKKIIALLTLLIVTSITYSQSCAGKWVTIDDETGTKKSVVELYKKDGVLYGKIIKLYPREGRGPNPKCTLCPDDRKDQPLVGLQIIRDMKWDGSEWEDGTIIDPQKGKIYTAALWLNPDNPNRLNVRGYAGIFYRTQTWIRVPE